MRHRDELPNPYSSALAAEGAEERSFTFHYLLASAVTAGVVVGGALAVGGSASADTAGTATAREDTGGRHGYEPAVRDEPREHGRSVPLMRLVGDPEQPVRSPADPVDSGDAHQFVLGVAGSLAEDRLGLEKRVAAIHTAAESIHPSPALGVWARKQLSRARETLDGFWQPATDGILDFAGSIAATAVALDSPCAPVLVASPALVHADGGRVSTGRELLEWGGDWVDRMAEDLVDTIDAMLDRIELRIVGRSAPCHPHPVDGRSPVLSVVGSEPGSGSA